MKDGERWFRICVAAAKIDGEIVPEEREVLKRLARRLELSEQEAGQIFKRVISGGAVEFVVPPREKSLELLRMVARVTAADAILQPKEWSLVERLGQRFGLSPPEIEKNLDEAFG